MRTARSPSRGRGPVAQRTLLAPAVLAVALLATAAVGVLAGRPVPGLSTASQAAVEARAVAAGRPAATATAPGPRWRVVATIGPADQAVTGQIAAGSATGAWSVWTGTSFTAVERLAGGRWSRVPLPASLTGYARSEVAFGGASPTDFWLFSSRSPTRALRFAATGWTLQPIPGWVLQRRGGTGPSVDAAVFSPADVWVFGLGAGAYAAHYDGRGWAKVRLPAVPDEVSAVAPDDIWALHGNVAWYWNGAEWIARAIPAAAGHPAESFDHLTATGPGSAWVWRTARARGSAEQTDQLRWDGTSWRRAATGRPAGVIESVAPDGAGGLWASGLNANPGGVSLLYHLTGGRWRQISPPSGIWDQRPESLTWVPGTRSVLGAAVGRTAQGSDGAIIKTGA